MPTPLPTKAAGHHLLLDRARSMGLEQQAARLIADIHPKYPTLTELLDLPLPAPAPADGLLFTRPADPEAVLDELAEAATTGTLPNSAEYPVRLPYWAEVWDSAFAIAQWLGTQTMAGQRVLDLGCGLGLTGAVACALGAHVTLADIEPPALAFARLNTLGLAGTAEAVLLDWRTGKLAHRYDLIIGADIVYERTQRDYLEPFFRAHLSPGAMVVLGEPGRQTGDEFLTWLEGRGWQISQREVAVPTRPAPVRFITLRHAGC